MSTPTRKRRWRSGLLGMVVVVLVFIGAVAWVLLFKKPYYYRDPAKPGYSGLLEQAMQAGLLQLPNYDRVMDETFVNFPDYDGYFDSITIKTNADAFGRSDTFRPPTTPTPGIDKSNLRVEMRVTPDLYQYADNASFDYHRLNHNEVFESAGGRIWIDHIAVAYGTKPEEMPSRGNGTRLPAQLFDMNFRELTDEQIREVAPYEWNRYLEYYALHPSVGFMLKGEYFEESKLLSVKVFDAPTHRYIPVQTSSVYPRHENMEEGYTLQVWSQRWHSFPMDIVVDIAFGPPVVVEFPAEPEQVRTIADGGIKLLAKSENTHQSLTFVWYNPARSRSVAALGGGMDPGGITVNFENEVTTLLAFAVTPIGGEFPLKIELLDDQGEVVPEIRRNYFGYDETFKELRGFEGEIKTVRAKYYPNRKRLIFRLPRIPGLPEENYEVENLFDVKVPFARAYASDKLRELVEGSVQMQILTPWSGSERTFVGPRDYQNVTVKDLVDELAQLHGPTYGAKIDQENLTIEFLDMSPKARAIRLWETMKSKLP